MPNWVNSTVEMELQNSDVKLLEAMKKMAGSVGPTIQCQLC